MRGYRARLRVPANRIPVNAQANVGRMTGPVRALCYPAPVEAGRTRVEREVNDVER
jgi:hypothetical protein